MRSVAVGVETGPEVGSLYDQLDAALHRQQAAEDEQATVLARLAEIGVSAGDRDRLQRYLVWNGQLTTRSQYLGGRALGLFDVVAGGDTVRWLKDQLKLSGGAAVGQVTLARSLDANPRTADLFAAGEISQEQAAIVAQSLVQVPPEDAAAVEDRLLGLTSLNAGTMRDVARTVVAELDGGADLHRQGQRAWKRRSLHIGPDVNGSSSVSGYLTSEAAVHWMLALEPWMRPAGKGDDRTADQRRHDAALQVMRGVGVADGGGGSADDARVVGAPANGRRPQAVITVPLSILLGEGGPPALLQGRIPIPLCELDRYLCEADLTVALQNAAGNIVYQSKSSRTFSRAQRRGLIATQRGCAWSGCDLPVERCDCHHLDEFGKGGKTTSDRGALTCGFHHNRLHREGWALVPGAGGGLRPVPPGDPENPATGLTPEEYMRRRAWAIINRGTKRQGRGRGAAISDVSGVPGGIAGAGGNTGAGPPGAG
ncbi:MAG: HNH endonuclease signature motif containing protein [Candidatus Dormibacteria bacterium]